MVNMKKFLFIILLLVLLNPVNTHAAAVETRVSQKTIQSFVEMIFPVVVEREILCGNDKMSAVIKLSNPRTELMAQQSDDGRPFLQLKLDYELTGVREKQCHTKGQISGKMNITVAEDLENLTLAVSEAEEFPLFAHTLSLKTLMNPVKIPLFKKFPLRKEGKDIDARFRNITLGVADDVLVIKSEVVFEKKSLNK